MSEITKFAIVGCGRISDLHAPGYLKNPHAVQIGYTWHDQQSGLCSS